MSIVRPDDPEECEADDVADLIIPIVSEIHQSSLTFPFPAWHLLQLYQHSAALYALITALSYESQEAKRVQRSPSLSLGTGNYLGP